MSNIVNIPLPPETIEWVAAVRIIEAALLEFSDILSKEDAVAVARAWNRILQG
jgi:hypothetical protein